MSRDSGSEHPSQRTVAELIAEYGDGSQRSARRRRRRAEDPSETAPQAIINRVMSDSGQMRAVDEDGNPVRAESHRAGGRPTNPPPAAQTGNGAPQANAAPPPSAANHAPPASPPSAVPPAANHAPPANPGPPVNPAPPVNPVSSVNHAPPAPAVSPGPPRNPAGHAPPEPPQQPEVDDSAPKSADFWAKRFAAAGAPPKPQQTPNPQQTQQPESDAEATLQQAAMPRGPLAHPSAPTPPVEGATTEQFPPVHHADDSGGGQGTAMMAYPQDLDYEPDYGSGIDDPYDFDSYENESQYGPDFYADGYGVDGYADSYGEDSYGPDTYGDEDYDPEVPAGLDSEDYLDDEDEDEEDTQATSGKEWAVFVVQGCAGLLGGGAVWFGFRWLWTEIAVAALIAALVVTGCLVFIARRLLRTDDMQTILLAVLVGLICTVSPAALLLIGQ